LSAAHYPEQVPVEAYGNGGFRFAGMSHKGSILLMPSGVFAWPVSEASGLTLDAMLAVLNKMSPPQFLLLGTGAAQVFPALDVRNAFLNAKIGLDVMSTGAAARTYNVLLAEKRPVAAALIAVE
jgi:uncharacterized protein